MSMTVKRRKDVKYPSVIIHKVADIRGGVSVNTSELGGDYLREGSVLSAPDNGITHVVKTAQTAAPVGATEKTIKVRKGHNFKLNDYVLAKENSVAAKITAINTTSSKEYDTLTIGEALGEMALGESIAEAKAASTASQNTSVLKYAPLAIVGTGKAIEANTNLDTDAWVMAVTKGNALPECVAKHLKGIINY